jgi:hypothetical protein
MELCPGSFFTESAMQFVKPATESGLITASEPPAMTASA